MNIKAMYAAVAAEKTKLEADNHTGFCFITSDHNMDKNSVAGVTAEVTLVDAAKHIVNRTAHLSSNAEIGVFKEAGRVFSADMAAKELAKNPMAPLVAALTGQKPPVAAPAPDDKKK